MGEGLIVRRGTMPTPWGNGIHYYWEGDEFESITGGWVLGYQTASGTNTKNLDNLQMTAGVGSASLSERAYTTDIAVNLTDISKIKIEWEANIAYGASSNDGVSLNISTSKSESHGVFNARLYKQASFSKMVDSVDVSGLSGVHYVRVHAVAGATFSGQDYAVNNLQIYKVWGEK